MRRDIRHLGDPRRVRQALVQRREELGLSQEEAARLIGVSTKSLSDLERTGTQTESGETVKTSFYHSTLARVSRFYWDDPDVWERIDAGEVTDDELSGIRPPLSESDADLAERVNRLERDLARTRREQQEMRREQREILEILRRLEG